MADSLLSAATPCDSTGGWFDYAPSPLVAVEGPGHIVRYANPAFCLLIDRAGGALVGRPLCEILTDLDDCCDSCDRVFRTGQSENHAARVQSDASLENWSYSMWPVRAAGRVTGVVIQVIETAQFHEKTLAMNEALVIGSLRQHELTAAADSSNALLQEEISERKLAEEALHRAQAALSAHAGELEGLVAARTSELAATNQQLEAFVYSIAHDLRAPLRTMQGFSEILATEMGAAMDETGRGYARRINKAAHFMDALLTDLLDFSRVTQQQVELTPIALAVVVESVLSRLEKDIQEKGARVLNSGPWPAVRGHEPTLNQMLFNLVSNAMKFVPPGVAPVVNLRTEIRGEFVRVWVEDNGIGIAPSHQDQVFGLFTRLHGAKFEGTGIGLAIVQKGTERMGGRVGVDSAVGCGSRFWFEVRKV